MLSIVTPADLLDVADLEGKFGGGPRRGDVRTTTEWWHLWPCPLWASYTKGRERERECVCMCVTHACERGRLRRGRKLKRRRLRRFSKEGLVFGLYYP